MAGGLGAAAQLFSPLALIFVESAVVLSVSIVSVNGAPAYNTSSIVLITESCKLLFSLAMLVSSVPDGLKTLLSSDPGRLLKLSVPGLLYCINNNVFLHVLSDVMPASFQVLLQLRVIWTGLLFRLVMGKHLSGMQWLALLVLSGGAVLTQTRGSGDDEELGAGAAGASGRNLDTALHMVALGLTLLYTLLSSLAGVYTELLLKRGGDESIHLTNVPLYTWGVIFNVGTLFVQGSTATGGFWRGWDRSGTWVVMILLTSTGLIIANVLKRFDNIVKLLCLAVSNVLTYVCSILFMGYPLTFRFVLGSALVFGSAYLYSFAKPVPQPASLSSPSGGAGGAGAGGAGGGGGASEKKASAEEP